MNRKQRKELRKDKNLIKNLYAIIEKYLSNLSNKFDTLTDIRDQSYINYDMKVIGVTRLFGLLCCLTSLSTISDDVFNTDDCIDNISTICKTKLNELPHWENIQDVFINIKIDELREIQKFIISKDGLYATTPIIKIYEKYNWKYIFNLKPDRLKEINSSFEENITLENKNNKEKLLFIY